MKRRTSALLIIGLVAVVAVGAIGMAGSDDTTDTGELLPTVDKVLPDADLSADDISDADLFFGDEPITGDPTSPSQTLPETGGLTPLAPEGGTEPAPSDLVLFVEGEPVS